MKVTFGQRESGVTGATRGAAGLSISVDSYSHSVIGGPTEATLTAYGSPADLHQLMGMLRVPTAIFHSSGARVWWGYVQAVKVRRGALVSTVSLDSMANSVTVQYEDGPATTSGGWGLSYTTTTATNGDSISIYGSKSLLLTLPNGSATAAAALRDLTLAQRAYPVVATEMVRPSSDPDSATITLYGFWRFGDWAYFANNTTTQQDVGTQIYNILYSVPNSNWPPTVTAWSSILTSFFRNGTQTIRAEVEKLMQIGTGTARYLSTVDHNVNFAVYPEPTPDTRNLVGLRTGVVVDSSGAEWANWQSPVGQYIDFPEVAQGGDLPAVTTVSQGFIEESTYFPATGELRMRMRDNFRLSSVLSVK